MGFAWHLVYEVLNRPRFRDQFTETTESGYEEDSVGRPYEDSSGLNVDRDVPHVEPIGGTDMGSI